MSNIKYYTPHQFAFFRIILGAYLCIHFIQLIPYAPEMWSRMGVLPDASLNLTYGKFPNLLYILDTPLQVQLFVGVLLILSIMFTVGFQRQSVSFLLWYGWVCLFDRNNLINNPGIPFIGWILLSCVFIPNGEPYSLSKTKENWQMPLILFAGAWFIMATGYTISGIDKFQSPSWNNGSAMLHLLNNPLARNTMLRDWIIKFNPILLELLTWSILTLEIIFLPLAIFRKSRKWIWIAMVSMHFGILLFIDFADLTIGMLMMHLFTFDIRWIKSTKIKKWFQVSI